MEERRYRTRQDQVGEWDDEEGGGEGESKAEGWEQHRQYQGRPIWQLLLQKGLEEERGEKSSGGHGSEKDFTARGSSKARGGIRTEDSLIAAIANHRKKTLSKFGKF